MDLSEDDTSESESDSSVLDDDDDDDDDKLSDDHNLAGEGEQNNMSFQDDTATRLGRSSSGGGVLGGASLRDRGRDDNGSGGVSGESDIDFLKRRARQLLHSQETHNMEGRGGVGALGRGSGLAAGGASLMPKLELAEPGGMGGGAGGGGGRVRRRWDDHPSSSSSLTGLDVRQRHSLPLLSANQASGQ